MIYSTCQTMFFALNMQAAMARNVRQYIIIHLFQGAFLINYKSIWSRDFTIFCITNTRFFRASQLAKFNVQTAESADLTPLTLIDIFQRRNPGVAEH